MAIKSPPLRANRGTPNTSMASPDADKSCDNVNTRRLGSPSWLNLMRCFSICTKLALQYLLRNRMLAPLPMRGSRRQVLDYPAPPTNHALLPSTPAQDEEDLLLEPPKNECPSRPKAQVLQASHNSSRKSWPRTPDSISSVAPGRSELLGKQKEMGRSLRRTLF